MLESRRDIVKRLFNNTQQGLVVRVDLHVLTKHILLDMSESKYDAQHFPLEMRIASQSFAGNCHWERLAIAILLPQDGVKTRW